MAQHRIHLHWDVSQDEDSYTWTLDSGVQMVASDPRGLIDKPDVMDPEEAFLAAICSCHLLSFVTEAAREGFTVQRYEDHPIGVLAKNAQGRLFVGKVLLAPKASFGGVRQPDREQVLMLHERASEKCIISNSVVSDISLEPVLD